MDSAAEGVDSSQFVDRSTQLLQISIHLFHLDGFHLGVGCWKSRRLGSSLDLLSQSCLFIVDIVATFQCSELAIEVSTSELSCCLATGFERLNLVFHALEGSHG